MDASEPRPRHRGYFLNSPESPDGDPGEEAAAEGVTIRVRIIRLRTKRRAAGIMRRNPLRPPRSSDRHHAARRHSS